MANFPQQNYLQSPLQSNQQQPSIEQGAVNNNKQQTQNFMSALNQAHAGSNNTFMQGQNNQQNAGNLINGVAGQSNSATPLLNYTPGSSYQGSYRGGNNTASLQGGPGIYTPSVYSSGGGSGGGITSSFTPNGGGLQNPPVNPTQYYNQNPSISWAPPPGVNLNNAPVNPANFMPPSTPVNTSPPPGVNLNNAPVNPANFMPPPVATTPPPGTVQDPNQMTVNPASYMPPPVDTAPPPGTTQDTSSMAYNPASYASSLPGSTSINGQQGLDWSGINTGFRLSDENLKENIAPGTRDIKNFMEENGVWSYKYKNPELDGKGRFTGPMAQELEKTNIGKQAVINTPRGKMVDTSRLTMMNTAGLSVVYQETQKLNKQLEQMRQLMMSKKRGK